MRAARRRGNAMLEFGIAFAVLFPLFAGSFQFGYSFYLYNELETQVRGGARYAAKRVYDSATSTPTTAYRTAVANMVVYGDPAGGTSPVVPGLTPSNVSVVVTFANNIPAEVTVSIVNYNLNAVVKAIQMNGKPKVSFPYSGRWGVT